jgi:hypothetical protein
LDYVEGTAAENVIRKSLASLKLLDRCRKLRDPITFITRLRLETALYEAAPPTTFPSDREATHKGERLPNLSEVTEDPTTAWKPVTIANGYGGEECRVEIASEIVR